MWMFPTILCEYDCKTSSWNIMCSKWIELLISCVIGFLSHEESSQELNSLIEFKRQAFRDFRLETALNSRTIPKFKKTTTTSFQLACVNSNNPNPIHLKKNNNPQFPVAKQKTSDYCHSGTSPASKTVSPWPKTFLSLQHKTTKNPEEEDWTGLKFPKLGELVILYLPIPMENI